MGACTSGFKGCCGHDARFGEYEFSDIGSDPNSRLTLTNKATNNAALVKHIKYAAASRIALSVADDIIGRAKALEQAVHYAPLVKLKVISGNLLAGSELTINAMGFEGGHRREKDGITYFGCKKRSWKSGIRVRQAEIINDVVIKLKDKDLAQLYRGRHFQIKYYPGMNSYRLKDLGVGFGTFVKIDKPLPVSDGSIIMIGDSFLILNLLPERVMGPTIKTAGMTGEISLATANNRLKVTVYAGAANGEILYGGLFYFLSSRKRVRPKGKTKK